MGASTKTSSPTSTTVASTPARTFHGSLSPRRSERKARLTALTRLILAPLSILAFAAQRLDEEVEELDAGAAERFEIVRLFVPRQRARQGLRDAALPVEALFLGLLAEPRTLEPTRLNERKHTGQLALIEPNAVAAAHVHDDAARLPEILPIHHRPARGTAAVAHRLTERILARGVRADAGSDLAALE